MMDKKITIEDQTWLATGVFIALEVTIGRGALIRARSSVFSDMPKGMTCVGSPQNLLGLVWQNIKGSASLIYDNLLWEYNEGSPAKPVQRR